MKKLILANNEEKKIIRHLHESAKRQYLNLNEQGYASTEEKDAADKDEAKDLLYKRQSGWSRDGDGPLVYWRILFNVLVAHGIPVKWERGSVGSQHILSSYMYWNGWIIYKDLTTNGGYPILFQDSATNVSAKFKFVGGKYAGQPADKIILDSESINLTFNLGLFGKYDNKKMSEYIIKYQKSYPIEGFETSLSEPKTSIFGIYSDWDSEPKLGQKNAKRPPNPIVTELQTNLNTKFSSGLVEDGYLGQKTRNAIYDALTKGSQQTTQQTITVPQQVKSDGGTPNDDN